jgi:alpha-1,3-mannosyltransferase
MQSVLVQGRVTRRDISGVAVCCGPPADWVAAIDGRISKEPTCLAYVNTHTAYLLARDESYRSICRQFTLLNDGIGLDILSLIKYGRSFEFNLNGSDFTPFFLRTTRHRFRIFLLGGKPGVAERAAIAMRRIAPQHKYVGTHRGHLDASAEREVADRIRATQANLVIVGFGNPDQEIWMAKYARELGVDLVIGVGALLDFQAGSIPRAPGWMQRVRAEWLHRLVLEPKRLWKRYVVYTPLLILQALAEKRSRHRWISSIFGLGLLVLTDIDIVECRSA